MASPDDTALPALRLADALLPLLGELDELEGLKDAVRDRMREACAAAASTPDQIAEAYWRLDSVPVTFLAPRAYDALVIARAHPYWSWRCETCGKEIFVTSRTDLKTCHRECQECVYSRRAAVSEPMSLGSPSPVIDNASVRELRSMPYPEYLKTPHWQRLRKEALRRAAYRCQVCNRDRMLHVHHRTYERRGCELARDLIVLCDQCHALYHGKGLLADHAA